MYKYNLLLLTAGALICLAPNLNTPYQSQFIIPQKTARGVYQFKTTTLTLEVSAREGGRISALSYQGTPLLIDRKTHPYNWGSVLWPSPQSLWNWPPPPTLNKKPYSAKITGNELVLASKIEPKLKVQFIKKIKVNAVKDQVIFQYQITNHSLQTQSIAPWEVTRVPAGGLTFFPAGDSIWGNMKPLVSMHDNICWFQYNPQAFKGDRKLFADGNQGWIAHVHQKTLLIKEFQDLDQSLFAPKEAEIEIYLDIDKLYEEIEQQGPYVQLAPGESIEWEVKWTLAQLPQNLESSPGNNKLVEFVQNVILN
jgi:hypothetical protein